MCSPPQVKSPSITIYLPFIPLYPSTPLSPLIITILLSVSTFFTQAEM